MFWFCIRLFDLCVRNFALLQEMYTGELWGLYGKVVCKGPGRALHGSEGV